MRYYIDLIKFYLGLSSWKPYKPAYNYIPGNKQKIKFKRHGSFLKIEAKYEKK